jgi:hypothetical protein
MFTALVPLGLIPKRLPVETRRRLLRTDGLTMNVYPESRLKNSSSNQRTF